MALKFHTDMITTSNSGHLRITLTAPTRPHCDMCGADLPTCHLHSSIEGELVRLCSSRCATELARVWAPQHRRWPWRDTLLAMAAYLGVIVGVILSL